MAVKTEREREKERERERERADSGSCEYCLRSAASVKVDVVSSLYYLYYVDEFCTLFCSYSSVYNGSYFISELRLLENYLLLLHYYLISKLTNCVVRIMCHDDTCGRAPGIVVYSLARSISWPMS